MVEEGPFGLIEKLCRPTIVGASAEELFEVSFLAFSGLKSGVHDCIFWKQNETLNKLGVDGTTTLGYGPAEADLLEKRDSFDCENKLIS